MIDYSSVVAARTFTRILFVAFTYIGALRRVCCILRPVIDTRVGDDISVLTMMMMMIVGATSRSVYSHCY